MNKNIKDAYILHMLFMQIQSLEVTAADHHPLHLTLSQHPPLSHHPSECPPWIPARVDVESSHASVSDAPSEWMITTFGTN